MDLNRLQHILYTQNHALKNNLFVKKLLGMQDFVYLAGSYE